MINVERQDGSELDPTPRLELPRGKEGIPEQIDTIFWDVDGTITEKDKVDLEIAKIILHTADSGVQHNFVTGRDRFWLIKHLKAPLVQIATEGGLDVRNVLKKMEFYPELGLVKFDSITERPEFYRGIRDHPLIGFGNPLRENLATFFLREQDLVEYKEDEGVVVPPGNYVIRNADGKAFLRPLFSSKFKPEIKFTDFLWSETKEFIGTAEVVREFTGEIDSKLQRKIKPAADILTLYLNFIEYDGEVKLSPVSTAINIAPIIDGIPLDKDWAAGRILQDIQARGEGSVTLEELAQRSIGIGDGYADFLFSRPRIGKDQYLDIAFVFIGPEHQFHDDPDKSKNLAVQSLNYSGPKATLDALQVLKDRFVQK